MGKHFPHAFGWALKPAREAAGLTIRQLADKAGIHWVTVSALENRRKEPTTRTLWRLANALGAEFRFDGFRWSTGSVGEADALRDALRRAVGLIAERGVSGEEEERELSLLMAIAGLEG
jgi:transcriptional regulator with XRE-family HTH domain